MVESLVLSFCFEYCDSLSALKLKSDVHVYSYV